MASQENNRPQKPVLDFGKGSREQSHAGAMPTATIYDFAEARRLRLSGAAAQRTNI